MDLSSVFDKKVGDFNKKGISKPYKLRAGDSERLSILSGGKYCFGQGVEMRSSVKNHTDVLIFHTAICF